ncbi:hypothetical protein CROQUDRAFT_664311 [Cronartium quercuum f. sp. fusiforme G11]|uniref:SigF-like NTF2-like domain-containing protein n=1 Tax=Cronartium quercuum f. sp. fusiforme G11 TaxID=708437 RepID=A0A9P6NC38_9BASI|nr:hypothetical protein CROQUDRAFT_664311 [Cronartium quercuum f. sp. fusiforme G11]
MEDPVKELAEVVRSITEPYEASVLAKNVDKYFSDNAILLHPFLNQPNRLRSKENIKGIYKIFRVFTINNKIDFHAVMFNEDKTQAAIELTEYLELRLFPRGLFPQHLRFIIRVDLQRDEDSKYRIYRQSDNFVSDLATAGFLPLPITVAIISYIKLLIGFLVCIIGRFLLKNRLLGP